MKVYNYTDDGIYIGCGTAQPSPLEPGKFLIPRNATPVEPPSFNSNKQAFWNGITWEVQDVPQPEPQPEPQPITWDIIRAGRNFKLLETDWVFTPDSPIQDKQPWIAYRQALRNIPQNFTNPEDVIWPTKP